MESRTTQLSHLVELERQGLDFTCGYPIALNRSITQRTDSQLHMLSVLLQLMPSAHLRLSSTSSLSQCLCFGSCLSEAKQVLEPVQALSRSRKSHVQPDKTSQKNSQGASDLDRLAGYHEGLELVELPGGWIVAADSEDAQAYIAAQAGREPNIAVAEQVGKEDDRGNFSPDQEGSDDDAAVEIDYEVHKLWADMGLSRQARSKARTP